MIEAGHAGARGFSPAQLEHVFVELRRRRTERDVRALCIAAAGANGGKAFAMMLRELKRELKPSSEFRVPSSEPVSEMPLSAADFQRMMKEENGGDES